MAGLRWRSSGSSLIAWQRCSSAGPDGSRSARKPWHIWRGQKVRARRGAPESTYQQRRVVADDNEHREIAVSYQHILYEVSEKIATITLHRPDRMNAWTPIMEHDVRHAMEAAAADDNVRVIVLTGSGAAFFPGPDQHARKGPYSAAIRSAQNPPP